MKKKILIGLGVVVVLIIILMVTGVLKINFTARYDGDNASVDPSEVKMENYTSTAFGYSLSKPVSWEVEEGTGSGGGLDVLVSEPQKLAFVSIRAMSDNSINSPETILASINQYKNSLSTQTDTTVTSFQIGETEANVGGFMVQGTFTISEVPFQFEERGLIATNGRVLIMRSAAIPQAYAATLPLMQQVMQSFSLQ